MDFSHKAIEKKWQKYWEDNNTFKTSENSAKKAYILDMFPYPSGAGLHVGHMKGYTSTDVFARFKKMSGYDVLHPIGWDAFGLPAEQYALKTGNNPIDFTYQNIETFRKQVKKVGFCYDYEKEINTSHPNYYKVTQWIFKQLYKSNLAENKQVEVNWCPELGTVLANDEILEVNGRMVSERGEHLVIKRKMKQWVLKITDYADKLLESLDSLQWSNSIKELQKNWIGKSSGMQINFKSGNLEIPVFTTRADTIYGATYLVLAPENKLVAQLATPAQEDFVSEYIQQCLTKSEIERKDDSKEKTGVFTGSFAINPLTGKQIPIWIADYVLNNYATGSVMAVPAHDKRDWEFATKFGLEICFVIETTDQSKAFVGEGKHINSEILNGLDRIEALKVIQNYILDNQIGKVKVNYKLRDWLFSRQRFYGEPFPIVYDREGNIFLVDDKDLPVTLPITNDIKPTGTGESPLANLKDWVNLKIDNKTLVRETNTMPQSAGSSWYFLAYILTDSPNELIEITSDEAKSRFKKWLPVDLYVGGQEHAVGHLLYSRFWTHFLYDIGVVPIKEPFQRLFNQGMILGPDGRKMSKSWGNVISSDLIIESHGADALRVYEMFMGPLDASLPWSFDGMDGAMKWLNRAYRILNKPLSNNSSSDLDLKYNLVVKNITSMIEDLKFNTAISQLMVLLNSFYKAETIPKLYLEGFIKMLSIFAPHLGEEMWEKLGNIPSIIKQPWPTWDDNLTNNNSKVQVIFQVNGKLRGSAELKKGMTKDELISLAKENENVKKFLIDKIILKEIVIIDKIVNLVVK